MSGASGEEFLTHGSDRLKPLGLWISDSSADIYLENPT